MRTILTAQPQQLNPQPSQPSPEPRYRRTPRRYHNSPRIPWQTVSKITVELTDYAVRIRFPAKPSEAERGYLKLVGGMRWTPNGNYWYAKRSPETQEFAARLEQHGFPLAELPKTAEEKALEEVMI